MNSKRDIHVFSAIKNYIIGTLFVLTCTFGYVSYSLYGSNVLAQSEVSRITKELETATENVGLAQQSCKVGQDITKEVNVSIKTQMDRTTKRVEALVALPVTTPQEDEQDGSKATTGARSKYADGGRISPSLKQLLDEAYCDSNKNDSTCPAK